MASPGSFIRSAAQATSSAYRRLPIRWRLAGGSALLTLVILLGFATIVGVLTTRRLESEFNRKVAAAADDLRQTVDPVLVYDQNGKIRGVRLSKDSPDLDDDAGGSDSSAVIRVVSLDGDVADGRCGSMTASCTRAPCRGANRARAGGAPCRNDETDSHGISTRRRPAHRRLRT